MARDHPRRAKGNELLNVTSRSNPIRLFFNLVVVDVEENYAFCWIVYKHISEEATTSDLILELENEQEYFYYHNLLVFHVSNYITMIVLSLNNLICVFKALIVAACCSDIGIHWKPFHRFLKIQLSAVHWCPLVYDYMNFKSLGTKPKKLMGGSNFYRIN